MQIEGTKACKGCGILKPESEFPQQTAVYKGRKYIYRRSSCKACKNKQLQEWRGYQPKTPKRGPLIPSEEAQQMKSPIGWSDFKRPQGVASEPIRTYPVCNEGHRYVGKQCLPCKYGVIANSMA